MRRTSDLKPCPFCGKPVRYTYNIDLEPDGIMCSICHYIVRFPRIHVKARDKFEVAMSEMAAVWNRRAGNVPDTNVGDIIRRTLSESQQQRLTDIYVRDRHSGRIHRVGDDQHDNLTIDEDGQLRYYNLQCGEGCSTRNDPRSGFEFVPNTDEYGFNMDPRKEEQDG